MVFGMGRPMATLMTRRRVFVGLGALALGGAGFAALGGRNAFYAAITETVDGAQIDAPTAHRMASDGTLTLVDIRRPEEWAATGSGEGAVRLDMRRADFISELTSIVGDDPGQPIALICARGVRSARMTNLLTDAGFTNIIDVPEGMMGSSAGPGWLARGLPLVRG